MTASTSLTQEMLRREDVIPYTQEEDQTNNCLPNEILLHIFSHLSVADLLKVRLVCRNWKELVSNLPSIPMELYLRVFHPELKISYIGESFWRKYEPYFHLIAQDPLYKDREEIVAKAKKMLEEVPVEDDAGITLVLEPEGFSFTRLREGCKTLNGGGTDLFSYVSSFVVNWVGNDPVKKTQLLGLTTGIVKDSRSKTVTQQQEDFQKIGCKLASVQTLSLLSVATFLKSREEGEPIRLLGAYPARTTYSRCIESEEGEFGVRNACVGGFRSAGLVVCESDFSHGCIGVVALREF